MTKVMWTMLVTAISSMAEKPSWLQNFGRLSYEEISGLPKYGNEAQGAFAAPYVTEKVLAEDYLDFLREQMQLGARGPEWQKLLQHRLAALQPYLGCRVLTVDFRQKPNMATLWINAETGDLFHFEIDRLTL